MKNIEEDWELEGSVETYVDCVVIPMGYDIFADKKDLDLLDVKKIISKPIPGKDIRMLGDKYLQKFFSWGLDIKNSISVGEYLANKKIEINIALDRMVRRHFGVFASTGSGKSNFIAQLIRLTSQEYLTKTNREIKIIIFDVQGELRSSSIEFNIILTYLLNDERVN